MVWKELFTNFAVVALFVSLSTQVQNWPDRKSTWLHNAFFGSTMGLGAIASMALAVNLAEGFIYDLRASLVVIAAGFGGPAAALAAGLLTVGFRLYLGGAGTSVGIMALATALFIGLVVHFFTRKRRNKPADVVILSLGAAVVPVLGLGPLVATVPLDKLAPIALLLALLNFAATAVGGAAILFANRAGREHLLLRAASAQSTDFQYVKDAKGRFILVNNTVARYHGFSNPAEMIGKTDFDLDTPERAGKHWANEQEMMRTGTPIVAFDEAVVDRNGATHWFSTSKAPVFDEFGVAIGTAGVTRDITERKRLERQATANRQRLALALSEMADGVAMFNAQGRLILCNDRYRKSFPLTGGFRKRGAHLRDILQKVVETGEQTLTGDDPQKWIDQTFARLRHEGSQEIQLSNGHWLQLRRRLASDGTTLVAVSDITKLKLNELELQQSTRRLRQLASIDGLTGLVNRRIFDERLGNELARAARDKTNLSLLLVDIDHFKLFNDNYGHVAGDKCLRLVAKCLRDCLARPADIAARYGGEEFTIVLPQTDLDGAAYVAHQIRARLAGLAIPHKHGINGIVSASIGVACHTGARTDRTAKDLINRADEALYNSKATGRDKVTVWQPGRFAGDARSTPSAPAQSA